MLSALLFLPATALFAQRETRLTAGAGPAWDINPMDDPQEMFNRSVIPGTFIQAALSQEITGKLYVGTGFTYHRYYSGLNLADRRPHQPQNASFTAMTFPLRVSRYFEIPALVVDLQPHIGYHYGIVRDETALNDISSLISDEAGTTLEYSVTTSSANPSMHLLEAGITVIYPLENNWSLAVDLSRMTGLRAVTSSVVDYTLAGTPVQATALARGSRWQSAFTLEIPVSNLWHNKQERQHRRIEHSTEKSSFARKNHRIYFGGDIGLLWQLAKTSSMAVGTRYIESRGFFRYSHLHTGIFAGYMFNDHSAVDIGAYYRRSGTCLSLMYDHETDYFECNPAPMYLEVPLMFRYYVNLYRERLLFYPTVGGALLTHFSSGDHTVVEESFDVATTAGVQIADFRYVAGRPVRFGYLVKAGFGLEYRIPMNFPLLATFSMTYSHGFRVIEQGSVTTSIAETPEESTISYRGNGWKAALGFRIPILLGKENRRCGAN